MQVAALTMEAAQRPAKPAMSRRSNIMATTTVLIREGPAECHNTGMDAFKTIIKKISPLPSFGECGNAGKTAPLSPLSRRERSRGGTWGLDWGKYRQDSDTFCDNAGQTARRGEYPDGIEYWAYAIGGPFPSGG